MKPPQLSSDVSNNFMDFIDRRLRLKAVIKLRIGISIVIDFKISPKNCLDLVLEGIGVTLFRVVNGVGHCFLL